MGSEERERENGADKTRRKERYVRSVDAIDGKLGIQSVEMELKR